MSEITRPGASHVAVTKSDTVDIAKVNNQYPRALYVGGAGDVVLVTPDGVAVTYSSVPAGSLLPVQTRRVNSASTTATNMVAIY